MAFDLKLRSFCWNVLSFLIYEIGFEILRFFFRQPLVLLTFAKIKKKQILGLLLYGH
jgi:hypothetical protein